MPILFLAHHVLSPRWSSARLKLKAKVKFCLSILIFLGSSFLLAYTSQEKEGQEDEEDEEEAAEEEGERILGTRSILQLIVAESACDSLLFFSSLKFVASGNRRKRAAQEVSDWEFAQAVQNDEDILSRDSNPPRSGPVTVASVENIKALGLRRKFQSE